MNLGIHLALWPIALLAYLGTQGHCGKQYVNLVGVNKQTDRMTPSWWRNSHRWGLRFNINVCRLAERLLGWWNPGCEGAFSVAAVAPCQFELDEDKQTGKKTWQLRQCSAETYSDHELLKIIHFPEQILLVYPFCIIVCYSVYSNAQYRYVYDKPL